MTTVTDDRIVNESVDGQEVNLIPSAVNVNVAENESYGDDFLFSETIKPTDYVNFDIYQELKDAAEAHRQIENIDPNLSTSYINKLCSIGVHSLEREPGRLLDEKNQLEETLKEEAFKNYHCFLEAHQCSKNVKEEVEEIENKLDKFIDRIPFFQDKLTGFADEAKGITKRWRQASLMLSKYSQLIGFLEIPQLMGSCVRKCYYDEALQLYSYIQRIDRLHGKEAPLIQTISSELSQCKELMISQLLKELYGDIQLPVALKIIGYLRRINVYNETELRIKFLNARDSWLQGLIKEVPKSNPLIHMSKLIEIYRVNLFNTVTQYKALFSDEQEDESSSSSSSLHLPQQESNNDRDFGDSAILASWFNYKIDSFLEQLKETLDKCLSPEYSSLCPIDNLFDPCFYFGLSMSRIGADFRPDLVIIFQRVILIKFTRYVESAVDQFEANMENFSISSVNTLTSSTSSSSLTTTATITTSSSSKEMAQSDYEPPSVILNFPPLAYLCNDLIQAFNQIRKLIPLALIIQFRDILNQSLIRATQILINYHKTESTSIGKPESDLLKKMMQSYINQLIPHIQKCLSAIAPVQQLAKHLGLSVLEYNRLKKTRSDLSMSDLDIESIKQPIDHLL